MAYSYYDGERKTRPGVYQRTSVRASETVVGAIDGVVAFAMQSNWGPVDKVTTHTTKKSIINTYGSGESVEAACSMIDAGASTVYIKRLSGANGTEGTAGKADIDSTVTLNAKYPGARELVVTVKEKAADTTKKQVVIKEGTTLLESFEFATNDTDDTEAFMKAVANSAYISATKKSAGLITAGDYTLKGTDTVCTAADYADAYYALEPFRYNVLAADSIDEDVFATLCAYAEESYENGKLIMVVGGATPETAFADRLAKAKECDSERIVYFGSSWVDKEGNTVEGAKAVAYVAGVIAATPANQSIVHTVIEGATDTVEKLTNSQYIDAINSGLLLVSASADGEIWFDSGINTLINLDDNQDAGWKKIKRVRTRNELMDRIDRTLAPLVGKVNCNPDGVAFIIQKAMGVIKEMIAEVKLFEGATFYEDPEQPYDTDSAWFIIDADDIDTMEKIYLHYRFRQSAN